MLTAVRMQVNSAFAESAHALVDMISLVADQHASMAANWGVQGLMAAAISFIRDVGKSSHAMNRFLTHLDAAGLSASRYTSHLLPSPNACAHRMTVPVDG